MTISPQDYLNNVSSIPTALIVESTRRELDNAVFRWRHDHPLDVVVVRGSMCRTTVGAYAEFSAAFQFPLYFGWNLMALEDLLTDLEWKSQRPGWLLVVSEPSEFYADEIDEEFERFARVLARTKAWWAGTIRDDFATIGPNLPFNVVLGETGHVSQEAARWEQAGFEMISSLVFP